MIMIVCPLFSRACDACAGPRFQAARVLCRRQSPIIHILERLRRKIEFFRLAAGG
jgi:hypothetical protein